MPINHPTGVSTPCTAKCTVSPHLDEIAGLLAQGYVRLRKQRAGLHTSGAHSSDDGDSSLDFLR